MAPAPRVSLRALLLGTGPRFARDALGPVLVFYLGWRLVGLTAGILGATALALQASGCGNVERFRAISGATGLPLTAALMTGSVGYGLRGVRRSEEWGWALRG